MQTELKLNYRSGVDYTIAQVVNYLKQGIGTSKRHYKQLHGKSPYIHSYETLERYIGIINNFKDTILVPSNVKTINRITAEHVDTHFENLLAKNCSEKTVNSNASALIKFFETIRRQDLSDHIAASRDGWLEEAKSYSRTKPFTHPERVISAMREPYRSAAVIQYLTGARVSDIRKAYEWLIENPSSTVVTIRNSKGGRDRTLDYSERPRSLKLIQDAVENIRRHFKTDEIDWLKYMKEYTDEVKNAARKCDETYCGTHAFRVNYADNRYAELSEKDELAEREKEILSIITEDLGHSRLSMAKYYISAYR